MKPIALSGFHPLARRQGGWPVRTCIAGGLAFPGRSLAGALRSNALMVPLLRLRIADIETR